MDVKKGRPTTSVIRQNMVEILASLGDAYGYQLSKVYNDVFVAATRRVIYYHLAKGVELDEFAIARVEKVPGDFSWGPTAEKTYYKLGPKARPRADSTVKHEIERVVKALRTTE